MGGIYAACRMQSIRENEKNAGGESLLSLTAFFVFIAPVAIFRFYFPFTGNQADKREKSNIQNGFLGVGAGGGFSGTNPLWVCDAACVNTAGAKRMRKRSAGHAMRSKPGGFATREQPIQQKQGAYASKAQGMR